MGGEWPVVCIDDICADSKGSIAIGPFGSDLKSECYTSDGVPVIRGTNIGQSKLFSGSFVYITEEKADDLGNANVYGGDLVFPHRGSIGEVGLVPGGSESRFVLSSSLMKLSLNTAKAVSEYVYYYFRSHIGKHEILKYASTVGTPGIGQPLTSLRSMKLILPHVNEQKAIAHILGSLDDKIELNRRMNETLEAMAQALFQSWFVDFDPVIDKALAAGKPIPEELKAKAERRRAIGEKRRPLPKEIEKLFPDEFEHTEEMGWVPKGWKIDPLSEHLYIKGRIGWKGLKKSEYSEQETGFRIINGSDFMNEQIDSESCGWISKERYEESPEIKLTENDILITKDGTIGKLAFVKNLDVKTTVASGVFVVRANSRFVNTMYCWSFFKSPLFQNVVKSKIDGSVIPHLYQKDFVEMFIPILNEKIADYYETISTSFFEKIFMNKVENKTLAKLRDTLLPKLISGELRFPDAEKLAAEVL